MNKWISSLAMVTLSGALLALPNAAGAGMVQMPQNLVEAELAGGVIPVHSTRHSYGYNSGAAIVGAIIGGLAYGGYGHHSYRRHSYGYGSYGYRHGYGYGHGYGYRPSYGHSYGHSYGGYGGYGSMNGGYR